jgi:hypothetical protein
MKTDTAVQQLDPNELGEWLRRLRVRFEEFRGRL